MKHHFHLSIPTALCNWWSYLNFFTLCLLLLAHNVQYVTAIKRVVEPHHFDVARRILQKVHDETLPTIEEQEQERNTKTKPKHDQVITPEDHLVKSLPYLNSDTFPTKHYAGHLPASQADDKKLFYWLFEPDTSTKTIPDDEIPLLIWLNGGPGCSSMDGLWLENGPFRLTPKDHKNNQHKTTEAPDDWTIEINPFSWHMSPAYVLYIDQPVGTGLSFTKKENYCKNDLEINIDFYYFLEQFLTTYTDMFLLGEPEEGENTDRDATIPMRRPLFFSGESHAGHYIPSMMDYILKRNDDKSHPPKIQMELKGAAIGNGWIDPYNQYAAAESAFGAGLVDLSQVQHFARLEKQCKSDMDGGNLKSDVCFGLMDDIIDQSMGKNGKYKVSSYDTRIWERKGLSRDFPHGHKDVERYLGGWKKGGYPSMDANYEDVLVAIHAEESIAVGQQYQECTDPPYYALVANDGLGVVDEIVHILDHKSKPKLLFFNGMNDLICNHVGNEKALANLPWKNANEWIVAKRYSWEVPATPVNEKSGHGPAGFMKEFENLMFLKVPSSGHMVPMDLPFIALEMMKTFMFGGEGSFSTYAQDMAGEKAKKETCEKSEPCPKCEDVQAPSVDELNTNPDMIISKGNEDNKNDSKGKKPAKMVFGGWIVIVISVLLFFIYNHAKRRKQARIGHRIEDNDDEHELELQSKGGLRYRDDPDDAEEGGGIM